LSNTNQITSIKIYIIIKLETQWVEHVSFTYILTALRKIKTDDLKQFLSGKKKLIWKVNWRQKTYGSRWISKWLQKFTLPLARRTKMSHQTNCLWHNQPHTKKLHQQRFYKLTSAKLSFFPTSMTPSSARYWFFIILKCNDF
jgi:hypothetical protein